MVDIVVEVHTADTAGVAAAAEDCWAVDILGLAVVSGVIGNLGIAAGSGWCSKKAGIPRSDVAVMGSTVVEILHTAR